MNMDLINRILPNKVQEKHTKVVVVDRGGSDSVRAVGHQGVGGIMCDSCHG